MFKHAFFYYLHIKFSTTKNLMNQVQDFDKLLLPVWINLAGSFVAAFLIALVSIPTIVKISKFKKLNASVNERTSHSVDTPNLGGVAVFAGVSLSVVIFSLRSAPEAVSFLLGGLILIFFIGIKDDILIIDPKKKLIGQICASLIIVWFGGVRITDFQPVLDYEGIPPVLSISVTLFLFLLLVNGFNLIDGIDGLASGLGIVISVFYGSWFIYSGHYNAGVIALSLAGALIAFFRYNIFSRNNKLFLGDTGSMITGFMVAFLTIQFIEYNLTAPAGIGIKCAPAVAYGLLIVPLIDMLKVFILRSWNGNSPFKADRNHIHHTLLALGCSHLEATLILSAMTIFFLAIALILNDIGALWLMILLTVVALLVISIPRVILKTRIRKDKLIQNT